MRSKREVFEFFGVGHTRGYKILNDQETNRRHGHTNKSETRGQPRKLSKKQIDRMDEILQTWGLEGRSLTWNQLGAAAETSSISWRTIQRAMHERNYRKCLACTKTYVPKDLMIAQKDWAWNKRNTYSLNDWKRVRFSDEVHFGRGPQRRLRIIRKPGERTCQDCIQEQHDPEEKDKKQKRYHCWAAVGWNFKSELIFYEVPSNSNGKMSQKVYIDFIQESVVKTWLETDPKFVLEEDGDSGHGSGKDNIVRRGKDEHGLKYYFNCPRSPDLSPIENCWQVPKQRVGRQPHWDDDTTIAAIKAGWFSLSQETINKWIESMLKRIDDVLDMNGKMTGW